MKREISEVIAKIQRRRRQEYRPIDHDISDVQRWVWETAERVGAAAADVYFAETDEEKALALERLHQAENAYNAAKIRLEQGLPVPTHCLWFKEGRYEWHVVVEGTIEECDAIKFHPRHFRQPISYVTLPIGRHPTGTDPGTVWHDWKGRDDA